MFKASRGSQQTKLKTFGNDNLLSLYQETYNLSKTAAKLEINIETLRKYFIKNNIPYNIQLIWDVNHNFFSQNNEKSFYWAGFLAADGNIEKHKSRIKLELSREDRAHVEKLKNDIEFTGPIVDIERNETRKAFRKNKYYTSQIRTTSKQIVKDLLKFNIVPTKSKIYRFPEHLIENENIRHFIRGLIEGDGWIYQELNTQTSDIGLSGTPECVRFVFNFLKQKLDLENGNMNTRENGLCVFDFMTLSDNKKIIHYLYDNSTIYLARKYEVGQRILLCKPRKLEISKDTLISMVNASMTDEEIAKELHCSIPTIRRRIKEFNI